MLPALQPTWSVQCWKKIRVGAVPFTFRQHCTPSHSPAATFIFFNVCRTVGVRAGVGFVNQVGSVWGRAGTLNWCFLMMTLHPPEHTNTDRGIPPPPPTTPHGGVAQKRALTIRCIMCLAAYFRTLTTARLR